MVGFIPKINADYMEIALRPRAKHRKSIYERKNYSVKDLQERHLKMLRLKHLGLSHGKIAEACACTTQNVSDVVGCELGRRHLAAMNEAADTKAVLSDSEIMEAAQDAHRLLKSVMKSEAGYEADMKTRVSVAEGYLGRAGFAPVSRNQNVSPSHFSQKELDEAKDRAAEAKKHLAPVPDNIVQMKVSS